MGAVSESCLGKQVGLGRQEVSPSGFHIIITIRYKQKQMAEKLAYAITCTARQFKRLDVTQRVYSGSHAGVR